MAFRVLTVTSLVVAVVCAVLWLLSGAGVLVPVAGARSSIVIAWTLLTAWFVGGWCLLLVPRLWTAYGPWHRDRTWWWMGVWVPVLPWATIGFVLADDRVYGATALPALLFAVVLLALGPRRTSVTLAGFGTVLGGLAAGPAVVVTVVGLAIFVPEAAWFEGPDHDVIVERISNLGGPYEVRWERDGWIYRASIFR